MPPIDCFPQHGQMFTHIDSVTGRNTCFAATEIRRWCDANRLPLACVSIEARDVEVVRTHRCLEPYRLRRALRTTRWLPLLLAHMPDGTWLMIDGSHSFVARHMLGHDQALAYLVPQEVWTYFTIDDLPQTTEEELASSKSGVP